jgi:hypothetical protein
MNIGLQLLEKVEQIKSNANNKKLASREKLIEEMIQINTEKVKEECNKTYKTKLAKAYEYKIDVMSLIKEEDKQQQQKISEEEQRIKKLANKELIQEVMNNKKKFFFYSIDLCVIDEAYEDDIKEEIALLIEFIDYLLD